MKHYILLFLLMLLHGLAYAQPPVMDSTWLPSAGDKYYIFSVNTDITFHMHGSNPATANDTGANVTWDFNSIFIKGNKVYDSLDYCIPSSRHIHCSNPNANLASGDSSNYECFIKDQNGLQSVEENYIITQAGARQHRLYSKPWPVMKRNFHFHQVYWDTSAYSLNWSNSNPTDSPYRGSSKIYQKYDAFGTLKIAGRQYDSTIRIHFMNYEKDTINDGNYDSTLTFVDSYDWYTPKLHSVLLTVQTFWKIWNKHNNHDTLDGNDFAYMSDYVTGTGISEPVATVQQIKASFNENDIIISGLGNVKTNFTLYDSKGNMILNDESPTEAELLKLSAPDIGPGIYILRATDSSGRQQSIKLVKYK